MGWTSSHQWYTPTVLRREYAAGFDPQRIKVIGWTGSWLKCISVKDDRPFVIDVMVRRFGKNEYGYKDVESSSGPYDVSQEAAAWLRRELAKRNMQPANDWEAEWLARCEAAAAKSRGIRSLKPGDTIATIRDFDCADGSHFDTGSEFVFEKAARGKIYCHRGNNYRCTYRLSQNIFF